MKFKVLLSDDEPWILKALEQRIPWNDLDLELSATAANGLECLEMARKNQPDLLITDVRMPGLNGLELAEALQRELPDIRIILISGFTDFEYARKGIELGVLGYLLKPIQQDELESILQEAVNELKKKSHEIEADWRQFRELIERGFQSGHLPKLLSTIDIADSGQSAVCLISDRAEAISRCAFHGRKYSRRIGYSLVLHILSGTKTQCEEAVQSLRDARETGPGITAVGKVVSKMNDLGTGIRSASAAYCRAHFEVKSGLQEYREYTESLHPLIDDQLNATDLGDTDLSLSTLNVIEDLCRRGHWPVEELPGLMNALILRNHRRFRLRPNSGLVPYPVGDELELTVRYPKLNHLFEAAHLMVNLLLSTADTDPSEGSWIIQVRQYIESHFSEDIHLGMLEEMFGKDRNLISQKFRSQYDLSISEFLRNIRIRHAEYLLRNTDLHVNTISELCGYTDYYYFAKQFKKTVGHTCSQYRVQINE